MRRFTHEDGCLMYGMLMGVAARLGGEGQAQILDALRRLFPDMLAPDPSPTVREKGQE